MLGLLDLWMFTCCHGDEGVYSHFGGCNEIYGVCLPSRESCLAGLVMAEADKTVGIGSSGQCYTDMAWWAISACHTRC